MKSKQQLAELIAKTEHDRYSYFNALFKYVPDIIVSEMAYMELEKGQYLLRAGEPNDMVYIILSGKVTGLDHQKMGHIYYFLDFTKMYVVGDFEVFGDYSEYSISMRAATDCKLLKISAKRYIHWVQHDENALFLRIKNIMSILTFERKLDREYIFMNCKERLVEFLARSYENGKKDSFGKYKMARTQTELADRVGFNVRSVQRSIASLEKEGLILIESGKITISSEQFLQLQRYNDEEKGGDKNGQV